MEISNHQVNHSPLFHVRGHSGVPILEVIDANTGNSSDCRTRFARGNSGDRARSVLQLLRMAKHVFMVALQLPGIPDERLGKPMVLLLSGVWLRVPLSYL